MSIRACAPLMSLLLTGCFATVSYTPDEMPVSGLRPTEGQVTIVPKHGEVIRFDAPVKVMATDNLLRLDKERVPASVFRFDDVEEIEVRAFSPGRTTILALGAVGVVMMAVATGMLIESDLFAIHLSGRGIGGNGGPLGF